MEIASLKKKKFHSHTHHEIGFTVFFPNPKQICSMQWLWL